MTIAKPLSGFRLRRIARFAVTTGGWPASLVRIIEGFGVFKYSVRKLYILLRLLSGIGGKWQYPLRLVRRITETSLSSPGDCNLCLRNLSLLMKQSAFCIKKGRLVIWQEAGR